MIETPNAKVISLIIRNSLGAMTKRNFKKNKKGTNNINTEEVHSNINILNFTSIHINNRLHFLAQPRPKENLIPFIYVPNLKTPLT